MPNDTYTSSITTWTRLEPRPRDGSMAHALQAQVHDPLWLLARQWQFGEFQGEDAGSAIRAELSGWQSQMNQYAPGRAYVHAWQNYTAPTQALEVMVEGETVLSPGQPNVRLALEMGQQFFLMLGPDLSQQYRLAFLQAFSLNQLLLTGDVKSQQLQRLWAGRLLDGLQLYYLLQNQYSNNQLVLPITPPFNAINATDLAKITQLLSDWMVWCADILRTNANPAWVPERLEYEFSLAAATSKKQILLHAPEHDGGHLDWYAFDLAEPMARASWLVESKIPAHNQAQPNILAIKENAAISWLQIQVELVHPRPREIELQLESPSGKFFSLEKAKVTKLKEGFAITASTQSLADWADLQGKNSAGNWQLHLFNKSNSDATLRSWSLEISLEQTFQPEDPVYFEQTVLPTPIHFSGMPATRWWEFEDSRINFGAVEAGPEDLGKLLLIEFALSYGNDFFMIPIKQDVGSLCQIQALRVTNTFGETFDIKPISQVDGAKGQWKMFRQSSPNVDNANLFFLAPTLGPALAGPALEEVRFLRDEMANLAWAVERLVPGPIGLALDRYEAYQAKQPQASNPPSANAQLQYSLASEVPDYWIPLIPEQLPRLPDGRRPRAIGLKRGGFYPPLGQILEPGQPLILNEETVPRSGILVQRAYQFCRWINGSGQLWISRSKKAGRGEGSSGLVFDRAEPR